MPKEGLVSVSDIFVGTSIAAPLTPLGIRPPQQFCPLLNLRCCPLKSSPT